MDSKHTPTPWGVADDGHIYRRDNVNIPGAKPISLVVARYNDDSEPCADNPDKIRQANGRANAAFIVRASNAHEELLAALKATLTAWAAAKAGDIAGADWMNAAELQAKKAIKKAEANV